MEDQIKFHLENLEKMRADIEKKEGEIERLRDCADDYSRAISTLQCVCRELRALSGGGE